MILTLRKAAAIQHKKASLFFFTQILLLVRYAWCDKIQKIGKKDIYLDIKAALRFTIKIGKMYHTCKIRKNRYQSCFAGSMELCGRSK